MKTHNHGASYESGMQVSDEPDNWDRIGRYTQIATAVTAVLCLLALGATLLIAVTR